MNPIHAGARSALLGAQVVAILVMAGCAPASEGPLVGPRVEPGEMAICVPAAAGTRIFFGQVLENTGAESAIITGVSDRHQGVSAVEYLVDTAGPELGQVLGGGGLPPTEPLGGEDEVFARATPAKGTVIPAGSSATLYVLVSPDPEVDSGEVDQVVLMYESGGRDYREAILVEHTVVSGESC